MAKYSRWRPEWTRPFVIEPDEKNEAEDGGVTSTVPWPAVALFALFAASTVLTIVSFLEQKSAFGIALITLAGASLAWTAITRPQTASGFLALTSGVLFFLQAFTLITNWEHEDFSNLARHLSSINLGIGAALIVLTLNINFRSSHRSQSDISKPGSLPSSEERSPEDNLTLWQWMSFSWMTPMISTGYKRQLNETDVWKLAYEFQHRHLHDTFRQLKGSVIRRLLRANGIDLCIQFLLCMVELASTYSSPFLLQKLLRAMNDVQYQKGPALKYGTLILLVEVINAQSGAFSLWFGRRVYERSRGEMITMLYEKTLNRKIVSGTQEKENKEEAKAAADGPNGVPNGSHVPNGAVPSGNDETGDAGEPEADTETTALLGAGTSTKGKTQASFMSRVFQPITTFVTTRFFKKKEAKKEEEKGPASTGKILNLMKNDIYEIAQRMWDSPMFYRVPIGFALSTSLSWRMLGPSSMAGVGVLVFAQILSVFVARIVRNRDRTRRTFTDKRLQETTQFIEAIRHLRWYGWADHWQQRILGARLSELNARIVTQLWNIVLWMVNALGCDLMVFCSLAAYVLIYDHELRVDVAFPALELLGMVQNSFREVPDLFLTWIQAQVAIKRLEEFMAEPNKEDGAAGGNSPPSDEIIELKKASYIWPGTKDPVLKNLDLSFPPGLHIITGGVAAGKSALLKALLGELDLVSGEVVSYKDAIAYCAQQPWLQSMSVRDNILFVSEYDETRYRKVIEACALITDFEGFKEGDKSAIGENGIGLSGGQKSRVALARALYSDARVLLLDDPLSSLDQNTAEYIVEHCLRSDLVEDRTVILVTHRLDLVKGFATQRIAVKDSQATVSEDFEVDEKHSDSSTLGAEEEPGKQEATAVDLAVTQPAKAFESQEERAKGEVKFSLMWRYIKQGRLRWWGMLLVFSIWGRISVLAETWFVKQWGEAYGEEKQSLYMVLHDDMALGTLSRNLTTGHNPFNRMFDSFPDPAVNVSPWLWGLFGILVFQSVGVAGTRGGMMGATYCASKSIFTDIISKVSGTHFAYYDVTPVGRLMNRFTSDVGTVDGGILMNLYGFLSGSLAWTSSILIIASITPLFLLVSIALSLIFITIFRRYLPTSQSLRRLEMTSLSPLMSNFGALLEGLMTVRAFKAQSQFMDNVIKVVDRFQAMDHMYWQNQGWLSYRFDLMSAASTFILTIVAIYSGISPGLTAFALVSASKFVFATHMLCRRYGALQLDFVAVERVMEIADLEQEPKGDIQPPAGWPNYKSDIIFENVTLRYAPHLDPALVDVSCRLPGATTTAVIGRTGSGKSTLALSLLGILPLESGRILIDGIDISQVDKQALRSRITFLAQEPTLFPGTLRHNLDPTEEFSEAACEAVMARISSASKATSTLVGGQPWTLSTTVEAGGKNLSHGQRQLVGLARAILRRSAIVIMDEATASIDQETAWEVQRLLREELAESTVVTIAHRAEAVHGIKNALVLGKGRVLKQGDPNEVHLEPPSGVASREGSSRPSPAGSRGSSVKGD